jgi:hypothetical protein
MTARSKDIPVLPLRAQITIEVSAQDYVEAAEHQRRAEALFAAVRRISRGHLHLPSPAAQVGGRGQGRRTDRTAPLQDPTSRAGGLS